MKRYNYIKSAINLLEKLLKTKLHPSGIENIFYNTEGKKYSNLFVANHFTRAETFIIPYVINKFTSRPIKCLADHSLFVGSLGGFLEYFGAISTKDKKRDLKIISDLATGNNDWIIYPEGRMVKDKKISIDAVLDKESRPKTGAAVLAVKSELYRSQIQNGEATDKKYFEDELSQVLKYISQNVGKPEESIVDDIRIIPVSITYYPLRPGVNIIKKIANFFLKKIPNTVQEELEIEGNILLNADININFCKPISVSEYIGNTQDLMYKIPVISRGFQDSLVIKYFKYRLTRDFMTEIYTNILINIDHIFVGILYHYNHSEAISIEDLKLRIICSIYLIKKKNNEIRLSDIVYCQAYKIISDQNFEIFQDMLNLCEKFKIISIINGDIIINKKVLEAESSFEFVRVQNPVRVILNELLIFSEASNINKYIANIEIQKVKGMVFREIHVFDVKRFYDDYAKYVDVTDKNLEDKRNKDLKVREPQIATPSVVSDDSKKIGILLCHGYKASPAEMQYLFEYFKKFDQFYIYSVRLSGHGTFPENMEDISFYDWENSVNIGFAALDSMCDKVILCGFSTGGLLCLEKVVENLSVKNSSKIVGVIAINTALKLQDIRARAVGIVNFWNEFADKFNIDKKMKYVDDEPENPLTNYSRNYIHGIVELSNLMAKCRKNLEKITIPTLVIQSDKDKIVNPKSSQIVLDNIKSSKKSMILIDTDRHVIVNGDNAEKVASEILKFIQGVL